PRRSRAGTLRRGSGCSSWPRTSTRAAKGWARSSGGRSLRRLGVADNRSPLVVGVVAAQGIEGALGTNRPPRRGDRRDGQQLVERGDGEPAEAVVCLVRGAVVGVRAAAVGAGRGHGPTMRRTAASSHPSACSTRVSLP